MDNMYNITRFSCPQMAQSIIFISNQAFIIISTSGHLLSEECDHLGEVDWSRCLSNHVVGLAIADWPTNSLKGLFQVRGGDDSVLVVVDDAERLFELLDLFL